MYNVVLTPCNRLESAFNFEAWQEGPQRALSQLLPFSLPQATPAPFTNSSPKAVIHSVPLQVQPQCRKGKACVRSQGPTPSKAEFQGLRADLQQLQQEKEAALTLVQMLQNQQAVNRGLLQRMTADMQNTAKTFLVHQAQWSSSLSSQLDNITKILNTNFASIDRDLKKSFYNHHHTYNIMQSSLQKSKQGFASIEA